MSAINGFRDKGRLRTLLYTLYRLQNMIFVKDLHQLAKAFFRKCSYTKCFSQYELWGKKKKKVHKDISFFNPIKADRR